MVLRLLYFFCLIRLCQAGRQALLGPMSGITDTPSCHFMCIFTSNITLINTCSSHSIATLYKQKQVV